MSKTSFLVQGGTALAGDIVVAGAKNAALKVVAASLLTDQPVTLRNLPDIEEVRLLLRILEQIGVTVERDDDPHTVRLTAGRVTTSVLPVDLASQIRSSIMLVAPLLARTGSATIPHPGGCIIGKRPIDLFIEGFAALGVTVDEGKSSFTFTAKRLTGGQYVFPWVAHTATESLLMASVLAHGETTIINAAMEPEVEFLASMLRQMGAHIENAGHHTFVVRGVDRLSGVDITIIPDRLEAGTFAILGNLLADELTIRHCAPDHLAVFWRMLERAGGNATIDGDTVTVHRAMKLQPTELRTHEYPGFPTDLQAPFTVLLTQASGVSLVHEAIFEGRLYYTDKLNKLGANTIMADPHRVIVVGPTPLRGTTLESPDIRAGIALLIGALIAEGKSTIHNAYQIDRGYERIEERLRAIGADIQRIES